MTKELIENIRVIIVPCMAYYLRQINYKNRGEIDAEQFSEDMNEILDLATKALEQQPCEDTISRQAAIDALCKQCTVDRPETCSTIQKGDKWCEEVYTLFKLPSAQPEIIRCKDCEYGEQDEVGRWFCRSLGCQIGNEDGSGYCADAERRDDG